MTTQSETLALAAKARRGRIHWLAAWSGVMVVGGAALMTLAYYQHEFGVNHAKMPSLLAWTFSIGLDWGGAIASIFWFLGDGKMARWGRGTAITLLVGSSALTAVSFATIAGPIYAGLGVIPSAVAFLMAKLLMLWQADRADRLGHVTGLDAYRAELERHRGLLVGYQQVLDTIAVHAVALVWQERAMLAADRAALEEERAELSRHRAALELEQAELKGALAGAGDGTRARRPVAPAGRRAPQRLQSIDEMQRQALEHMRGEYVGSGRLLGRPKVAEHLGLSVNSSQAKTIHSAAKAALEAEIAAGLERTGSD